MCGIAGFSVRHDAALDRPAAARVLLASIAERGADAAGMAYVEPSGRIAVVKRPGGASGFLSNLVLPDHVRTLLLHVRDHTKGTPRLEANNHPIRHGRIVGVHNGKISNDEAIFAQLGRSRWESGMTVDSEAIFALLDAHDDPAHALAQLRGSLATGWFDEAHPERIFLARGYARPLWIAEIDGGVIWASTRDALQIVQQYLGIEMRPRQVRPGSIFEIEAGTIVRRRSFEADRTAGRLANPVASPHERAACLTQLQLRIA